MNNAIKIQSITNGHISYAECLIDDNPNYLGISCRRDISDLVILTRRNMNRILVNTAHFKSKITPCHLL